LITVKNTGHNEAFSLRSASITGRKSEEVRAVCTVMEMCCKVIPFPGLNIHKFSLSSV